MIQNQKTKITEETHLTLDEVHKSLNAISKADALRLHSIEEYFSRRDPVSTLLVDAIQKTMDGTRSWKRGMGVFEHLYGVMRSLANNEHKKLTIDKSSTNFTDDEGEEKPEIALIMSNLSQEATLIELELQKENEKKAEEDVKEILAIFADNENATWILMGEMDGNTAEEIRELSGMTETQYATARRAIRRTLDKHYPGRNRIRKK